MATYGDFTGITTDGTYIYVAATNTSSVQYILKLDSSGAGVSAWNAAAYNLNGIHWYSGALYLCDANANKIVKYTPDGSFVDIASVSSYGTPKDITSDGTNFYVGLTNGKVVKVLVSSPHTVSSLVASGLSSIGGISYGDDVLVATDTSAGKLYNVDRTTGSLNDLNFPNGVTGTNVQGVFTNIFAPWPYAIFNTPWAVYGSYDEGGGGGNGGFVAGSLTGETGYVDSLTLQDARFNGLTYITSTGFVDTGNTGVPYYVVDTGNAAIRRINFPTGLTGGVSTFYTGVGITGGGGGGGAPCFLEGSEILCLVDDKEVYVPVENLQKGTLVKTSLDGYKKVEAIGKKGIWNPETPERIQQRLYKLTPAKYPELQKDLFLTGCHSILVDELTEYQRQKSIEELERIFVTDRKYRLIACVDQRAEPWQSQGAYVVWHFALESENVRTNYGVYANGGLLVESCSINYLQNRSNMRLM
jgi:hypothetical protein